MLYLNLRESRFSQSVLINLNLCGRDRRSSKPATLWRSAASSESSSDWWGSGSNLIGGSTSLEFSLLSQAHDSVSSVEGSSDLLVGLDESLKLNVQVFVLALEDRAVLVDGIALGLHVIVAIEQVLVVESQVPQSPLTIALASLACIQNCCWNFQFSRLFNLKTFFISWNFLRFFIQNFSPTQKYYHIKMQ